MMDAPTTSQLIVAEIARRPGILESEVLAAFAHEPEAAVRGRIAALLNTRRIKNEGFQLWTTQRQPADTRRNHKQFKGCLELL